jgi:hypothetical protein
VFALGDRIRANRKLCEIALREVNCVENEKHKVRKRKTLPKRVAGVRFMEIFCSIKFFLKFMRISLESIK